MSLFSTYSRRALVLFAATFVLSFSTVNIGAGVANASTSEASSSTSFQLFAGAPTAPGPTASIAAWQTWSSAQDQWIRSRPYAEAVSSEGLRLVKIGFKEVAVPGLPTGITETAAWLVVQPANTSSSTTLNSSGNALTSTTSACVTGAGPGSVCVGDSGSTISASYQYLGSGSTVGHVELGAGGCPGALVTNSADTLLEQDWEVVAYASATASTTWSSTFWDQTSSGYADWGTACADY